MSERHPELEFFAQLYDALTDGPRRITDLRQALEEQGIDMTGTVDAGRRLIEDHKKRQRLSQARAKLDRLRAAVQEWAVRGRGSVGSAKDEIARALAGDQGEVAYQMYHRKLETVSMEDLETLGEDAALLEFIVRIEADDSG